jgi:hypothetical protein
MPSLSGFDRLIDLLLHPDDSFVRPDKLNGLWLGKVEWCNDPMMINRIRVRIPNLHGDKKAIPTENLPAAQVMGGGGLEDEGSFDIYRPGTWVWVMFIMGDEDYPIVMGRASALPVNDSTANVTEGANGNQLPERDPAMGSFISRRGHEFPREHLGQFFSDPTRQIPFKTTKGASFVIEEADERESIELLDRSGQGIRTRSPLKKSENAGNRSRRGLHSVFRKSPTDINKTVDEQADIEVSDAGGQSLKLRSRIGREYAKLSSHSVQDRLREEGDSSATLELNTGDQRALLKIKVDGVEKGRILIDTIREEVDIQATYRIVLGASEILLRGNLTVDGDVSVSGHSNLVGGVSSSGEDKDLSIMDRSV